MDYKEALNKVKSFVEKIEGEDGYKIKGCREYEKAFLFTVGPKEESSAEMNFNVATVYVDKKTGETEWGFDLEEDQAKNVSGRFNPVYNV